MIKGKNKFFKKAFNWIIDILEENDIPYQITGGCAAHIYGSPRLINDIDIDVPEKYLSLMAEKTKNFIVFGPKRFFNKKWDFQLLDLNYFGQEIELGSEKNMKIFDDKKKKWCCMPSNIKTANTFEIFGRKIKVVNKNSLLEYKKLLNGDHQKLDIKFLL